LIFRHAELTGSGQATQILLKWDEWLPKFVRVIPYNYQRVLDARNEMKRRGLSLEQASLAAFESNATQVAPVTSA
jgi:glutamate synthase domain-containing protein 3